MTGSIIDFVAQTERPVSGEHVNDAFARMSWDDRMRGILGVTNEELVSMDIVGSTYSALVDLQSTMTLGDHTVKVPVCAAAWGRASRPSNCCPWPWQMRCGWRSSARDPSTRPHALRMAKLWRKMAQKMQQLFGEIFLPGSFYITEVTRSVPTQAFACMNGPTRLRQHGTILSFFTKLWLSEPQFREKDT